MYYLKYFIASINFSIPLSIDRMIEITDELISKKNECNNQKALKRRPNNKGWVHIILFIFLVLGTIMKLFDYQPSISNKFPPYSKVFNSIHCKSVVSKFSACYWKYAKTHNIYKVENFTDDDINYLKERFWKILTDDRSIFSQMPEGQKVINKVEHIYKKSRFNRDFDSFIRNNSEGSLECFEEKMIEYIENIQREISIDVFA